VSGPRILVVGASGMLGHQAVRVLSPDFEVVAACRDARDLAPLGLGAVQVVDGLDAMRPVSAYELLEQVRPDFVINAVGVIKQREEAKDAIPSITINSLWPHTLADACARVGARMAHVSTDCVFSGSRGGYTEADVPDAFDLYGRSKLLGEVGDSSQVVTLRTSIIGWQLGEPTGLLGWFAANRHESLKGYTHAVFSGLSTRALVEVVRDVVMPDPTLSGLWQLSAEPIDKHTLLTKLAGYLGWEVEVTSVDEPVIDRSLDSTRFRERTGWTPPSWDEMLSELAQEWQTAEGLYDGS